ncbi:MAG: pseudouridine synthase [Elusimicrobiales bacterium]|nr:pseudouridine synthase [Elusimicrobiales bacterium]
MAAETFPRAGASGKIYIIFNKPYGVVSQFTPEAGHLPLSVFNFPRGIYAAGRLDHDSEGLLLLTDDGVLQHRLCDPRFKHPRSYWAQVERVPGKAALDRLRAGITLSDGPCRPVKIRLIKDPGLPPRVPPIRPRKTVPAAWVEITLTEGRNRQVRRMLAAAGHPVLRLFRCKIGDMAAGELAQGQWRPLLRDEILLLKKSAAAAVMEAQYG